MAEQTKSIKELRNGLWSSDSRIVINTLQQVKNAGSTVLIPELAGLLRKDTGTEVTDHIAAILNNLKYQASADELVKVLREENDPEVISLLVSACWKNGLDYSAYVDDFIDLFLEYDYTTSLTGFEVNDATPANTALEVPVECPAGLPDNLTSCTLVTPNATNNTEGYQGAVNWQFDGQLAPGSQGTVSYDVRIQGPRPGYDPQCQPN